MSTTVLSTLAFSGGAKVTGLPAASADGEPLVREQVHSSAASRPASPYRGQIYTDPSTGETDIYVSDGTNSYWLNIA